MKANQVKKKDFLEWYFSDGSDLRMLGATVFENLYTTGKYSLTVEAIFKKCEYIPSSVISNYTGGDAEFKTKNCILID